MPFLLIATPPFAAAIARTRAPERVSCVITGPAGSVRLPATDPKIEYADLGVTQWQEIPVSGSEPILGVTGRSRQKVRLTGWLFEYRGVTADEQVGMLRRLAAADKPVSVAFGSILSASTWVFSDLSITAEQLLPESNDLRHAQFSIQLTRWAARARPKPGTAKSPKAKKGTRKVAVRKGETLGKFAARVCGDASHMTTIAKTNRIRDPKRLRAGQVLTVTC